MGNSRSQQAQQPAGRSLCLFYLIRRSWKIVSLSAAAASARNRRGKGASDDTDDCATDLSTASRCSGCKGCGYHQELNFDSESDMAPNAEEDLLVSMPRGGGNGTPHSAKERLRPPTYNPEDYAIALRRWGRRALGGQPDNGQNTLPSTCTSSSSGYASATGNGGGGGEMTLRQFTSVSELLNKLKADLRLAFPSFVQEFCSPPAEGISLLLETLRGVQLSQSAPPSATGGPQPRRPRARRAALDELGCVECLAVCAERCPDAPRILAQAHPGLLALAVCLTSSLNRSRVLALQLLTRVCQTTGGHGAVSEAVSTLRLRYAEGGRFRFLAGALLASKAALALRVAGLSFLNAFLATAPRSQTRLYIQAEACEAGLEPRVLQDWLKYTDDEDEEQEPLRALLREEVRKWSRHCVDVDALQGRARRAEETCRLLSKKVSALQRQLQQMQLDRRNEYNGKSTREVDKAVANGEARVVEKKVSSSAEDEGISFSERSSSPDDPHQPTGTAPVRSSNNNNLTDVDQETTIDDVIEELRIIVKDAEDELHDWNQLQSSSPKPPALPPKTIGAKPSKARECLRSSEEVARQDRGSLKILVPGLQSANNLETEEEDNESAIIPAILHPQPPRRTPTFLAQPVVGLVQQERLVEVCVDSEEEQLLDEDDGDSLLSASRLKIQNGGCARQEQSLIRRRRSLGSSLADFETSEAILESRRKNGISASNTAPHPQRNQNSNSLNSKQYSSKCANTVQRRTERRKYLRRCQSQEHMDNSHHNQETSNSSRGVIEQIRKFESMNSFDERRSLPNLDSTRLRRSESFHQTRHNGNVNGGNNDSRNYYSKDYSVSSRGGSDSGLTYNPLATSKSLDKIDEGLDSLVDIVVMKERSRRQLSCERQRRPPLELIDDRKYTSFLDTRRERNDYGTRQQPQHNDSRIFAGRPAHDVLVFGKNRFNAGKYSGNSHPPPPPPQFVQKNAHRHSTNGSSPHLRGKVTDVVSGLY